MSLQDLIAADQQTVFFNHDDFVVTVDLDGVILDVLLQDIPATQDPEFTGVLIERKRLQVQDHLIAWKPVAGSELLLNGTTFLIESVGGGPHDTDNGRLPWDIVLVRYLA